jgi:DNA-binding NtrC family response regulator
MDYRVLLIAPEDGFRHKVADRLTDCGLDVLAEADPDEAVRVLADRGAEVVLFAAGEEHDKDLALLTRLLAAAPRAGIILLEPGGDVDFAMQARRHGVFDDMLVPFEMADLLARIEQAGRAARGPQR